MANPRNGKFSNQELGAMALNSAGAVQNVYIGEVVHIDDPLNAGRIKVRIPKVDINKKIFCKQTENNGTNGKKYYKSQGSEVTQIVDGKSLNNLNEFTNKDVSQNAGNSTCVEIPWSTPFLPRHFQVTPKLGEMVKVIIFDLNNPLLNREWVGPIMSFKNKFSYDDKTTATSTMNTAVIYALDDPTNTIQLNKRGDFTGGFAQPLDVAISSRNNADIVMPTFQDKRGNITRGGEVLIRAGKLIYDETNTNLALNDKNPAYFRLKVLTNGVSNTNKTPSTHAMLFADFISFVSHKNGEKGAPGITKINPILETDADIERTHLELQQMIRGNFLIEFLELLRDYVANHNHPYPGLPSTDANSKPEILKFDLNKLLSPNIRIN